MTIYQAHKKAVSMPKKAYPVESGKYWCVEINHYSADNTWVTIRASFNWNKEGLYESVEDYDTDKFIAKLQEYIDQNPLAKKD